MANIINYSCKAISCPLFDGCWGPWLGVINLIPLEKVCMWRGSGRGMMWGTCTGYVDPLCITHLSSNRAPCSLSVKEIKRSQGKSWTGIGRSSDILQHGWRSYWPQRLLCPWGWGSQETAWMCECTERFFPHNAVTILIAQLGHWGCSFGLYWWKY